MQAREKNILSKRLIPFPKSVDFLSGADYLLQNDCVVETSGMAAGDWDTEIQAIFQSYWQVRPELRFCEGTACEFSSSEGYCCVVSTDLLQIKAEALSGVRNALKTLRQLAEVNRGGKECTGYFLQPASIEDSPTLSFRGVHLCFFPESTLVNLEKKIRLAAYHKFNYLILELWGVFPFASQAELCWKEHAIDKDELARLIDLGKSLGITICPQFNLLGHASSARGCTGKHAILDLNPKMQPLFEPDGWVWCLSNPETRAVLTDVVNELIEFFKYPEYFHIGCDEAINFATCRNCRRSDLKELMLDHIRYFNQLIRSKGARTMMWHDMLIGRSEERPLKGYYANAVKEDQNEQLLPELPRDIVIADWQYNFPKDNPEAADPTWETNSIFKAAGLDVVVCPWENIQGIYGQGVSAREKQLLGYLQTTWHHADTYPQLYTFFGHGAEAAWNASQKRLPSYNMAFTQHLRQVAWDMKITKYSEAGFCELQICDQPFPID